MDWNLGYTKILKTKNKKPPPASHFFAFSDDKLMFFFHWPKFQSNYNYTTKIRQVCSRVIFVHEVLISCTFIGYFESKLGICMADDNITRGGGGGGVILLSGIHISNLFTNYPTKLHVTKMCYNYNKPNAKT